MCETKDTKSAMLKGARLRCPDCGEGKLFDSYLKVTASCDACGLDLPGHLQGQSLLPILAGECTGLDRNWSFIETSGSSSAKGLTEIGTRTPSHLYGMCLDADSHRLVDAVVCFYDLENDPYEFDNIVGTGRAPDIEAELKKRLLHWHEHTPWLDDPDCGPDRRHLFDKNGMPLAGHS